MPRERKPSAKVREIQALEEEHGASFDSLLQKDMIKQALAMDQLQKARSDNDDDGNDGNDDEDAINEEARFLLARDEVEAVTNDDEGHKKRKKPAGTYQWRWDCELQGYAKHVIPDPPLPPKVKTLRLTRSAFSPLFPQIFTNYRLLHDLFLAPQLLSSSANGGDLLPLAFTCKAFKSLLPRGKKTVAITYR